MKRLIFFVSAVLCLTLSLVSCSSYSRTVSDFDAGETLTPEGVESILAAISEMEAAVTEKYPAVTDENGETVVFWTGSGSVWHRSRECPSLKRSTDIRSGNISAAESAGKKRACSVCGTGDS